MEDTSYYEKLRAFNNSVSPEQITTYLQTLLMSSADGMAFDQASRYADHQNASVRLASLAILGKCPKYREVEELITKFGNDPVLSIRENAYHLLRRFQ